MGEFELIRRYFASVAQSRPDVALGIGDDCALLVPQVDGAQLAVSIDTLVEGTHFLPGTRADYLAQRLLGAAVSDLAAMAARPAWFTLALTLPEASPEWLESFSKALAERAQELDIALVGGDTTRGPLTLSVQVHGWVEPDRAVKRSGAREGDLILVSGTLGDSRAGLQTLLDEEPEQASNAYLRRRFYCPQPRIALARALAPWLHSGIDISDGLVADLGHIAHSSGLGACVELETLPLSDQLLAYAGVEQAQRWALSGGEDFELCLTAAPEQLQYCLREAAALGIRLSCIGRMHEGQGVQLLLHGEPCTAGPAGYDHFGDAR
ncbi:thiamine-monophosphate kinase [Marinobacterium zhoushanense]|uniref:Thiamine-monophosphate kinase n=1 Tax=Marinobacterium zhoushanense TaxID=1679163 RepID=A0ABQ1KFP4_9GAMM|nr:thiamine-phosphate kinase [Marinobacterium zhoushanense]GGB98718.1 thiamine-monophosphate kinase [Marinobacterium zhoushanense]